MPFNYKTELGRYKRYYQNLESVSQKPATQAYSAAIFSFLAVSLFGWYAIKPTIQTILFLRREIEDDKKVSAAMETKIAQLIEAQGAYDNIKTQLPLLSQAVPADPETIAVVDQIKKLTAAVDASLSGVESGISPLLGTTKELQNQPTREKRELQASPTNNEPKAKRVTSVPLTVTVVSTYAKLHDFLVRLLALRRILTIESINIQSASEKPTQTLVENAPLRLIIKFDLHYLTQ